MEIEFDAVILQNGTMDAAYIEVPYDIRERTEKDRWLVDARFDNVPYSGQVVPMKTPFYLIGLNKQVRKALGKSFGDRVHVVLKTGRCRRKPIVLLNRYRQIHLPLRKKNLFLSKPDLPPPGTKRRRFDPNRKP